MRSILIWLRDWIWPTLAGPTPPGADDSRDLREKTLARWSQRRLRSLGKNWYDIVADEFEDEDKRRVELDARLSTMLGLIPIGVSAAWAVLGIIMSGRPVNEWGVPISVIYGAGIYLTIQCCLAFVFALRGLQLRAYERKGYHLEDEPEEDVDAFYTGLGCELFKGNAFNTAQNNKKADCYSLVLTALRNAFVGLILVVAALFLAGLDSLLMNC